jgi:hypothetical protein
MLGVLGAARSCEDLSALILAETAGGVSTTGSGAEPVSCAKGPWGCIASEVLSVSDMAMSWAEKTDGERAGADLRFQYRVTVLPNGVGLLDGKWLFLTAEDVALTRQSSLRWALVAAVVCGHWMAAPDVSAVGVLLPLLSLGLFDGCLP